MTSLLGCNNRTGGDEHIGRGYTSQRKETGNACKALSHSSLFWPGRWLSPLLQYDAFHQDKASTTNGSGLILMQPRARYSHGPIPYCAAALILHAFTCMIIIYIYSKTYNVGIVPYLTGEEKEAVQGHMGSKQWGLDWHPLCLILVILTEIWL